MQQNMMGQNIIITEPSSNLRALGRNALAGKWQLAITAVIIYDLCIQVPPAILNAVFGVNMGDFYFYSSYNNMYSYNTIYEEMPSYSSLSGIYLMLVTGAFTLGITLLFLALFRKQTVGVSDIFLGFECFGKALGLFLFQMLFIFLWALLLIVPGIIASIRYSQAFFILADDPSKGIRECMDESKRMMKGNKAKYFCLTISFIGWLLLSVIPAGVLEGIVAAFNAPMFLQIVVSIIGYLFMVPVIAYMYSTYSGFYEILAGHLIKETEPVHLYMDQQPIQDAASSVKEASSEKTTEEHTTQQHENKVKTETEHETEKPDEEKNLNVADVMSEKENADKEDKSDESATDR